MLAAFKQSRPNIRAGWLHALAAVTHVGAIKGHVRRGQRCKRAQGLGMELGHGEGHGKGWR